MFVAVRKLHASHGVPRRFWMAAALSAMVLLPPSSVLARRLTTINTRPLTTPPGGALVCTAFNVDLQPTIGITVQIIDKNGVNVTDFIRTNWASESPDVVASVDAETRSPGTCYCKVAVTGGRR